MNEDKPVVETDFNASKEMALSQRFAAFVSPQNLSSH